MPDITIDKVREALLFLIALILSISVHEFGHAFVATRLGDPLPRAQGRLTLSPRAHIDPIGTIAFPLLMFFTGVPLLGWGRPVETNPATYTRRFSPAFGHLLVSLAGPFMNLLMDTVVSAGVVVAGHAHVLSAEGFAQVFHLLIGLNLFLMFFNLLPIPPLDGGAILAWALPRSLQYIVHFLSRWGFLLLFGLMMVPSVFRPLMLPGAILTDRWASTLVRLAGL